ncbi:MAG TPA: DUF1801 domain-containing protein [Thermoanaerobaculia bacterium]
MTPQKQLDGFLAKYTPELAKTAKTMLRKMRKRLPGAVEMVYDNWNGLVIGFGPTERPSEAILSLLLLPEHVTLCFLNGAALRDPDKLLRGSGNQVRHIRLSDPDHLDQSDVNSLIEQAVAKSVKPIAGPGRLIIKSISPKQRPRRPSKQIADR